jgi:hypothetical protein
VQEPTLEGGIAYGGYFRAADYLNGLGSEFHGPGDRCVGNEGRTDAAVLGDREFDGSSGSRLCGAGMVKCKMAEARRRGLASTRCASIVTWCALTGVRCLCSIVTTSVDAQVAMDTSSTSKGPGAVVASPSIRIAGHCGRLAWNSRPPTLKEAQPPLGRARSTGAQAEEIKQLGTLAAAVHPRHAALHHRTYLSPSPRAGGSTPLRS